MMELIESVGNIGVLAIIAGVFIFEHITTNKKTLLLHEQNTELLKEMKSSNDNTAKALEIIQENQKHTINVTERIETKIDCIKEKADITKKKEGK